MRLIPPDWSEYAYITTFGNIKYHFELQYRQSQGE